MDVNIDHLGNIFIIVVILTELDIISKRSFEC